jgi:hypothetical protein
MVTVLNDILIYLFMIYFSTQSIPQIIHNFETSGDLINI